MAQARRSSSHSIPFFYAALHRVWCVVFPILIFQIPSTLNAEEPESWYVDARSVGTRRETEPPRYVKTLSQAGYEDLGHLDWIELGLDYRNRFEYRDGDLRKPIKAVDTPFLHRTRGYLGVRKALDPFRFGVEVAEAHRSASQFAADDRDTNRFDLLQAFGELYFEEMLGRERPVRMQWGRLAFEYLDRRLLARNEWRNTTNTFEGWRAILGQEKNDWQVDLIGVQPVIREVEAFDTPDLHRTLYGAIGNIRRWSKVTTVQPYYLFLDQDPSAEKGARAVHALGLRDYGVIPGSGYDYDLDFVWQFGHSGDQRMRAWAMSSEGGYTFAGSYKPRASVFFGYASGDRDPGDNRDQRFERLFGFSRPWSANDYISWDNVMTPKTRVEIQPFESVRMDGGYSAFWLASSTDSWANVGIRDPAGESGRFMGHELDVRARVQVARQIDLAIGYSHFFSGGFTTSQGKAESTDFLYVETQLRLF